jgi:hypothetical protein
MDLEFKNKKNWDNRIFLKLLIINLNMIYKIRLIQHQHSSQKVNWLKHKIKLNNNNQKIKKKQKNPLALY